METAYFIVGWTSRETEVFLRGLKAKDLTAGVEFYRQNGAAFIAVEHEPTSVIRITEKKSEEISFTQFLYEICKTEATHAANNQGETAEKV